MTKSILKELIVAYFFIAIILLFPTSSGLSTNLVKIPVIAPSNQFTSVIPVLKPKSDHLKIMVIDSGIGYNEYLTPWVDFTKQVKNQFDHSLIGHGTHVTGIIAYGDMSNSESLNNPICDAVEIVSCNIYKPWHWTINRNDPDLLWDLDKQIVLAAQISVMEKEVLEATKKCVIKATRENFDVINYSNVGSASDKHEFFAWHDFVDTGGIVVAAAGNESVDIKENWRFPASFGVVDALPVPALKNFYTVMNVNRRGYRVDSSAYYPGAIRELGDNVYSTLPGSFLVGPMTGTSQSAPMFVHKIVKKYCKENNLKSKFTKLDYISELLESVK